MNKQMSNVLQDIRHLRKLLSQLREASTFQREAGLDFLTCLLLRLFVAASKRNPRAADSFLNRVAS